MSDNATDNTAASKPAASPAPAAAPAAAAAAGDAAAAERLQGATKEAQGDQPSQSAEKSEKATANGAVSPPPAGTANSAQFKEQFKAFSKFGDTKSDGRHITLSQSDKWMKQAKVIDGKKITTTDTGIHFKKFKQLKITLTDYNKYLDDLAKAKKVELEDLKSKLANCGAPGLTSQAANSKAAAAVERLTDVSKYTGSHKQRFDEAGRGKGIAGRKDVQDGSGYVQGYKDKDTYNKTH